MQGYEGLGAPAGSELTTSDLLRFLAAEGAPFSEVAGAVARRFGGNADSRTWLARTLITLLRVSWWCMRAGGGQAGADGWQAALQQ